MNRILEPDYWSIKLAYRFGAKAKTQATIALLVAVGILFTLTLIISYKTIKHSEIEKLDPAIIYEKEIKSNSL